MVVLVFTNNLEGLLKRGNRVDPPAEITASFQNILGSVHPCDLALSEYIDGREVPFITLEEVRGKLRRLKSNGVPCPDRVVKCCLLHYLSVAEVLTAYFNVALFRGVFPRHGDGTRLPLTLKEERIWVALKIDEKSWRSPCWPGSLAVLFY